jgi:hypothetical protein
MFILQFIPDFVFHLILLAGLLGLAASFVLSYIPFISQYRLPIQIAASILIVIGVYMEGAISNNAEWEARVAELKLQVAKAEADSANANTKLTEALANNQAKITVTQETTKKAIQKSATVINQTCKINDISIKLYNQAVKGGTK